MSDAIFLRLGDNGALGTDGLQWVLHKPVRRIPPPPGAPLVSKDWRPVAYVHSTRAILVRCMERAGINLTDAALTELVSYGDTFDDWKAASMRLARAARPP
jgi:hypothetical protein